MSGNYFPNSKIYFRIRLILLMMFLVIGGVSAQVIFPYGETFKNATATGVILGAGGISNPAVLTGTGTAIDGITDPVGAGYLRLTSQLADQAGYARSTRKFPSRYGVTVNFEYYTWNSGSPTYTADGLSFFLFDATASGAFQIGGFGGSLGYAQRSSPTQVSGLSKGFLGIGFDEFGNFVTETEGRQGGNGTDLLVNQSNVGLRGDGDGDALVATNYEYLTHTRTTDGGVDGGSFQIHGDVNGRDNGIAGLTPLLAGYRKAKIEIIPVDLANNPDTISAPTRYKVNVWVTTGDPGGAVEHRVINDYIYTPSSAVPDSLSYGFAAATGGYQNYHEIRGLDIVAPSVFEFQPVLADVAVTGNEDTDYTFSVLDFTTGFLDPNGTNTLTEIRVESLPANGTLKLSGANISANQVISLANIPNITFTPNPEWHGSTSFNWSGRDAISYATTPKAVNITINSVNDAPAGTDGSISVLQDATDHPITAANFGFTDPNDVTPGPINTFNGVKITSVPALGLLELDNVAVIDGQDINLADITANKLTYTPVAAGNGSPYTTFTFQVLDNGGTSNGGVALDQSANTMTINVAPTPTITLTSANPVICFGTESANITYSGTTGTPTPDRYSIDWNASANTAGITDVIDGTLSGGTITITGLAAIAGGTYTGTLTVRNVLNTISSTGTVVTVTVNPLPGVGMAVSDPTICSGATATITLSSSIVGINYQLRLDAGNTNVGAVVAGTGGDITFSVSPTTTTTYNVLATNATTSCSATVTDKSIVTVNPLPGVGMAVSDATICSGAAATITLSNSVVGINYQLRLDSDNSLVGAVVAGTGGDITFSASPTTTTTYNVLATNATTSCSATVTDKSVVTVTPLPGVGMAVSDATICSGAAATITLSNSVVGINYQLRLDSDNSLVGAVVAGTGGNITFSASPTTTTTYNVLATNATTSCSAMVTDKPLVTVNTTAQPTTISGLNTVCIGASNVTYSVDFVTGHTYTWTYSNPAGVTFTATPEGNSITVSYANTAVSGTWSVSATNTATGCTSSARTLPVTVNSTPQPGAITGTASICSGSSGVSYSVAAVANTTYNWTYSGTGATIASGGGTNSITVDYASNATVGTWSVVATGSNACPSLPRTFAVTSVNATPTVAAITGASTVNIGATLTLESTTPGGTWSSSNTSVATVNSTGIVTGVAIGTATISYTLSSGACSGTATKVITISPGNTPPVAVADSYTVSRSGTLTVPANTGVLSNDTDANPGTTLTAIKVLNPAFGTVTFNSDGSFVYVHAGGTETSDSFTYKVNDGTVDGNTVTVTLAITPVSNSAPVAQIDSYNVGYLATTIVSAPGVLANDTDINNNPMTAIKVTNPLFGILTAFNSDGSFTYQHTGAAATTDSFTYKVSDGTAEGNTVTVTLNVVRANQAPLAFNDLYGLTRGSTVAVSAPGVLSNDSDPDGDIITAIKLSDPVHGVLTFNSNGSFTYVHGGGTNDSDSFTYKVNDGKIDGNTVTVSLPIALPGIAPVITDINKSTSKNKTYSFSSNDFSEKFVDLLHTIVKVKVVTLPSIGILKLGGIDVRAGQEINAANLADLTFIPGLDFIGTVSFQYNASCPLSYALSNRNVNINVVDPGVPPVAVADSYTTTRGGTITLALPGVLANDTDSRGLTLTAIKVSDPTHGALILNPNGSMVYVHDNSSATKDSFTYKANNSFSDSNVATVSISIPFVNSPPVLSAVSKIGLNANPIPFSLKDFVEKFTDSDSLVNIKIVTLPLPLYGILKLYGVPVTVNQIIGEADIKGLTFEPAHHWNGTTSFLWNASDGTQYAVNSAAVNISVTQPSDPFAKIGLAKSLISTTPNLNGTYDLKYLFTVKNYGPNDLDNISIKDNLSLAFIGAEVKVKSLTVTGNLKSNNGFNGYSDLEMLAISSSILNSGEQATLELVITVKLGIAGGVFQNIATAEAQSIVTGFKVNDISTQGLNPDPNGSGDVSSSDPTEVKLDLLPSYVPAGFSPNGDGTNDKFVVQNADGKQVSLEMYNRWGNRVYKSEDYKNDWGGEVTEGFFLGRDIPDGTYYYIIIIDKKDKYTGFITVNR